MGEEFVGELVHANARRAVVDVQRRGGEGQQIALDLVEHGVAGAVLLGGMFD
jgi:hypothetical protein